ncbi:head-tail connector protein [Clostridium perfringens]|uniref:head-tail connector protein n=1 Tax=Clostridium perfringens TaxID=1502 RepID=UPI0028CE261F|nr:head-tail connector protein [Clostridium perfringens]MDK0667349.1 head-tail connector protein [Clostridium perfringens]MDT7986933.1 head-tail connector protein [Clostridium perfringens]
MLEKVKLSLRIKSDAFNIEILEMIEAAKLDLSISGIKKIDEDDPLIQQAIKIYCKANFGLDNKDSEKYQKSYNMLKEHLSLCGDYNVG